MIILHIITGLDVGGAELMLWRLIEAQRRNSSSQHIVISLTSIGKVGQQLQALGIEVHALNLRSALDIPHVLWKMVRLIRVVRPDIVQTWMYHADLLGGLAARLAGNRKVIWGVRCSNIPHGRMSSTQMIVTLCSWLSHRLPSRIVCCAESAQAVHVARGYEKNKMLVIPNGYMLSQLKRTPAMRQNARAIFGFGDKDIVVGIVGRFDPMKDYRNFIRAATMVASKVESVKFLMIGRGIDSTNSELRDWLTESGIAHKFVLAGERSDIPNCLAGMDLFCLSSACGEGFPNVVGEAMTMNVPCVVTDVGDAAQIVFDTGTVVAPSDSAELAKALQTMIEIGSAERSRLGELARSRIEKNYSIEIASARFEALYQQVIDEYQMSVEL